jgi:PAS domain S-box-containing protein
MKRTESGWGAHAAAGAAPGSPAAARHDLPSMPRLNWVTAVTLLVLLSGVLVAFAIVHTYQREMDSGRQLTDAMAHLIEEQTSSTLHSIDQQLLTTARELQLLEASGPLAPQAGRDLLRRQFQAMPYVRASWITNAKGQIIHDSLDSVNRSDVSDRPYFQIYLQQPETRLYLGAPVRSRVTQQWFMSASRPIVSEKGVFQGVIVVAVEPMYFDRLWGSTHALLGGAIGLWRSDGTLMMRSPFADTVIGKSFPELPLFQQANQGSSSGTFSNQSPFDHESRIYAFRRLSRYPELLVAVGQSQALVTESWRNFTLTSVAIWLLSCSTIFLLGSFLDRAWRQNLRSSNMLRAESERLALATEAGAIGVFDMDLEHDQLLGTPAYMHQVGQAALASPIARGEWLDQVHPQDRPVVDASIRKAMYNEDPAFAYEIRVMHADGRYRWMGVTGRFMDYGTDGRATRLMGTRIDITERKLREQQLVAAEQSLRASEQSYRTLFEQAPGGIGIASDDTRMHEVNSELCELLGYSREELIGMPFAELVEPEQRKRIDGALYALRSGRGNRREWMLKRKDGAFLVADVVASVMPDGRIMYLVHDVTQRKADELALRGLLQEREALLREVHHRVKNNLQVIHSMLRLETWRSKGSDARSVLIDMQERVQSMALLHDMLYRVGKFVSVDVGVYLRQLCNQAMRAGSDRGNRIRLQLDLVSASLDMDQAMCCGLIVNELLSNCLKHGFPDGREGEIRVTLHAIDGGSQLRLCVSDTGVGLASDCLTNQPATMGLQLVADLAVQLEGQLEVEGGPGAAFSVTFARSGSQPSPAAADGSFERTPPSPELSTLTESP